MTIAGPFTGNNIQVAELMKILHRKNFLKLVLTLLVIMCASMMMGYTASSSAEIQSVEGNFLSNKEETLLTVPYISLRNKTGSENVADFYGGERGTVSAGQCNHSRISLDNLKLIIEKVPFYIPEDIVSLDSITQTDMDELWSEMKQSPNGRHPTIYTHGFNIDFEKGCRRAALFQKTYDLNGRFLFFSWPSDGLITNYTRDEADVYWSAEPMQRTLSNMLTQYGKGNINVVAHSLGSRGVLYALVMLGQFEAVKNPLLNQVVFIAPDIDAGVFKQYLPLIRPLARKITVYVSANDSPLILSHQLHGYPRLGEPGAHIEGLAGIEVIDISDISIRSPSGHIYHLHNNAVINDLDDLLNKDQSASKRNNLKQMGENYWQLQL